MHLPVLVEDILSVEGDEMERIATTETLGIPENSSWRDIRKVELARELGLSDTASEEQVLRAQLVREEQTRLVRTTEVGLPPNATWDEIWRTQRKNPSNYDPL